MCSSKIASLDSMIELIATESLDYVPSPREPEQAPPLPEFVPEPVYLKFIPLKDKILPDEEQPLPTVNPPTTDSPGYIPKFDPEEGHSTMTRMMMMMMLRRMRTRMQMRSTKLWLTLSHHHLYTMLLVGIKRLLSDVEVTAPGYVEIDRVLAIPLPPPSPLSPWSSPLHQIPSPPIQVSPPLLASSLPLLASPTYPLGYRAAMNRMRAETPSTSHPPPPIVLPHTRAAMAMLRAAAPSTYILARLSKALPSGTPPLLPVPLPTSSPYFLLPSTSHRADDPEVTLPPQKRLRIALGLRFKVDENSSALTATYTRGFKEDYGFVATLDDEIRRGRKKEDERVLMSDASNTTRAEVASLRTTVLAQQSEIVGLRAADRTQQTQLVEALTLLRTLQTQKIAPKTTTRSTTTTTTTTVTDAQLKALIDQGVANALAARDADRTEMVKTNMILEWVRGDKLLLLVSTLTKTS
nr:hypothetical protein [Tanacetum cinerariifolium]